MAHPDYPETEPHTARHQSPDREAQVNRWRQLQHVDPDEFRRDTDQIISPDAIDRIVDIAEDIEDRRELAAARAEDDFVPWEEVKAELGFCAPPQGVSPDLPWDEVKADLGLD